MEVVVFSSKEDLTHYKFQFIFLNHDPNKIYIHSGAKLLYTWVEPKKAKDNYDDCPSKLSVPP